MNLKIPKTSQNDIMDLMHPMAMDLTALFNIIYDDISTILTNNSEKEPEDIIAEINKMFLE